MSKVKMGDICDFYNGGAWSDKEYVASGLPVLKVSNCKNSGFQIEEVNFLPVSSKEKYAKNKLYKGDVIIATVGSHPNLIESAAGRSCVVNSLVEGFYLNQNAVCLRTKYKEILNQEYLGYLCKEKSFQHFIQNKGRGAANQMRIAIGGIKEYEFNLPDINIQRKIGEILSAYDDLIENNQKQIKLLEEAAQRLYKEWFVDLHFPGYKDVEIVDGVPEGWERTSVGKYLSVRSGYAFKSGWWQDTGYPVVKIKDIVNNIVDISSVDYVAPEYTLKIPEFKLNKGDIVIAMTGATIGKIGLVPEVKNLYTNQRVGKVFPNEELVNPTPFVFCFYAQKSILEQIIALSSSSSAQPNISGSQLESFEILANFETINRFNEITKQFFDMINSLYKQNCLLVQARDRLLPKLMSGEIEV